MRHAIAATSATLAGLALLAGVAGPAGGAAPAAEKRASTGTTGASGPVAAGPVIAAVEADVSIAAGGGWVVWSVPIAGGYGLEGAHAGITRPLPVAPRPEPFDLSVGTSPTGTPVVTFSRCAKTPTRPPEGGLVAPLTGSGCRVHALDLASSRETTPTIPHPTGTSDTTPMMWHGRIAFARLDRPHHQDVQQVLLWTAGHRNLTTLPHGALPTKCPLRGGCAGMPRSGTVEGLAYDGRLVSYLWVPVAPGVVAHGGWEVRADNVATGRSTLVTDGFLGEVCTGGEDLSAPSTPILGGYTVSLVALQAECYAFTSLLAQMNTAVGGNGTYAPLPGIALGLAGSASALYALMAPTPPPNTYPSCSPAAPCQIQKIAQPSPLVPEPHRPRSPFF